MPDSTQALLNDPRSLRHHVSEVLFAALRDEPLTADPPASSAVLFLLSELRDGDHASEPCLVLNKRSQVVKQPGDLCCPGGGISRRLDPLLARFLGFPGLPLRCWPHYRAWRNGAGDRQLPLIVAAAFREAYEEMRLQPLGATFLGLLPPQPLYLRGRAIRPAVAWLHRPQSFHPNWEVEKIVTVPLRSLLDPSLYARLSVEFSPSSQRPPREFPCFRLQDGEREEILWGATYRIVTRFLSLVFGFEEPALDTLPGLQLTLDDAYLVGRPSR